MNNKRLHLSPQYYRKFKCIGSSCEDNCCIGWGVQIDKKTYQKYQTIITEDLGQLLKEHIFRDSTVTNDDSIYAKIKMYENQRCPFLNESCLCKIQLKYGENYLSDVCSTYPRSTHIINNVIECSATMSCPEMARLALLQPNTMEFDEYLDNKDERIINFIKLNTSDPYFSNDISKYLWELRIFTITLIQNRSYELWERLIILGFFCEDLQKYAEAEKISDIPDLISLYNSMIKNKTFGNYLLAIPFSNKIQMEIIKTVIDSRRSMGLNDKRYSECIDEFIKGLNYTNEADVDEISERYYEAYQKYYKTFMDEQEYILENYLVNYIYQNLFPVNSNKAFEGYLMLVLHYAMIKVHLIGISAFHKELTEELVIKLIQSLTKTFDHSQKYLNMICDILKRNKLDNLAAMTVLIKN